MQRKQVVVETISSILLVLLLVCTTRWSLQNRILAGVVYIAAMWALRSIVTRFGRPDRTADSRGSSHAQ